jgi:hypothetical protein
MLHTGLSTSCLPILALLYTYHLYVVCTYHDFAYGSFNSMSLIHERCSFLSLTLPALFAFVFFLPVFPDIPFTSLLLMLSVEDYVVIFVFAFALFSSSFSLFRLSAYFHTLEHCDEKKEET